MVVKSSRRSLMFLHICVLTLLLTEVTLRVLGAGDLWVTERIPLLWLFFGVPGPTSWSLRSDEPVLPLNEKEYSELTWKQNGNQRQSQRKAYKTNNHNTWTIWYTPEPPWNWSSTIMVPFSSKTFRGSLGSTPFVWLQGLCHWASPYLSSYISHCSPAFSQPVNSPCSQSCFHL